MNPVAEELGDSIKKEIIMIFQSMQRINKEPVLKISFIMYTKGRK